MLIQKADISDLSQILQLQYNAYQSEAKLLNNYEIPPLKQTLEEFEHEYQIGIVLKALHDDGEIIGSVRGRVEGSTLLIGKLIVAPEYQGKGIGTKLLEEIEKAFPQKRYELFTSSKSVRNIGLYEKMGYTIFNKKRISSDLYMVYLEKFASTEAEVC
ncbi:MAG: GNAT family N-acetyltransferase [Firmicutes bacterium HGW-Firmicutes-16]|nr:MAG: GNAT family N-acetyltransferase [Firmicutes bacterium HGW-Firmicutes-16]